MHKHLTAALAAAALFLSGCAGSVDGTSGATAAAYTSAAAYLRTAKTQHYYTMDAIAEADVRAILEAGINAPSGMNSQKWHFTAVGSSELIKKVADAVETALNGKKHHAGYGMGLTKVPMIIVISGVDGGEYDAGLATQAMAEQAMLLGYGTKIMTFPAMVMNKTDKAGFNAAFDVPEGQSIKGIIAIGRPDTSVNSGMDGYTGPSTRAAFEEKASIKL